MTLWGWDASHYDGPLTTDILRRAKQDGVVFFTHKIAEGLSDTEGTMDDTALAAARSAGIEFLGGYFIPRTLDSAAQIDRWWQLLNQGEPWWKDHPGWFNQIDLERWSYDNVSAAKGIDCAKRWRDKTGRQTILYASRGMYADQLSSWDGPLWNADYGSNTSGTLAQVYPGDKSRGWTPYSGQTPAILQFGSRIKLAGLSRGCDGNAYRGSIDELRTLIQGDDMSLSDTDGKALINRVASIVSLADPNPVGASLKPEPNRLAQAILSIQANMATLAGKDFVDEKAIVNGVLAGLAGAPADAIAARLIAALPDDLAHQVVAEMGAQLTAAKA